MRSQPKDIHMLYLAMQHNGRNYFVEFAGFDNRGSAMNCSWPFNVYHILLLKIILQEIFQGIMKNLKESGGLGNN